MKQCCICGERKTFDEFVKCSKEKDGLSGRCKPCHRAKTRPYEARREYTQAQRERKKQYLAEYTAAHANDSGWKERRREANAKWRANNKDRVAAANAQWKRENSAKVLASTRKRQTAKQRACPSWADTKHIEMFYIGAKFVESLFGVKHHVDHIVPLRGKNVCGLHIPVNLRIPPAEENMRKGNRWQPT